MTDNNPIPIRVVFRRWRDGGGVIALLPELPADIHGIYCDSYMHVGQHGGADYARPLRVALGPIALDIIEPLAGLGIGHRLKWYITAESGRRGSTAPDAA